MYHYVPTYIFYSQLYMPPGQLTLLYQLQLHDLELVLSHRYRYFTSPFFQPRDLTHAFISQRHCLSMFKSIIIWTNCA